MICLYAEQDCEIDDQGVKYTLSAPEDPKRLKNKDVFVSTHTFAICHKGDVQPIELAEDFPFPPLLTREFIENPPLKPKIRMLAHNGIGGGIGDCIASLNAFKRLHEEFWKRGRHLEIDVLTQDGKWRWSDHVFMFAPYVHGIVIGGTNLVDYCKYDVRTDTEGYTNDMDASGMNIYDYACQKMLVDESGPHRPEWMIAEEAVDVVREAMKDIPRPRLMLNFFASALRSIPKTHRRKLVEGYAKQGYEVLIVSDEDNAEAAKWAMKVDHKSRRHVHDCTRLTSPSIHHLAAAVGEVDLVVTPDTGLMHMCGLAGVPTVAVFYSIEPALRIRDFPNIAPFCPEAFRKGPHWGMHKPALPRGFTLEKKEEMIRLMQLYSKAENVPGYNETWKQVDVEEILAVKPGERVESVIGIAPTKEIGNAEGQPVQAADTESGPEEALEGVHPTAGEACPGSPAPA